MMEDSSSFSNYTGMEPSRVVLDSKRATPTLGGHLNQAWSWPGRQERSSANVNYTLIAQSPRKYVGRSEVVARAYRALPDREERTGSRSVAASRIFATV